MRLTKGTWCLVILATVNLLVLVGSLYNYLEQRQLRHATAIDASSNEVTLFADRLETKVNQVMAIADGIAGDLSTGRLDSAALMQRLEADVKKYDYVDGLFVAYEPYAFSLNDEFFDPLFLRSDEGHKLVFLDYDYRDNDWYREPMRNGAGWVEPYRGRKSGAVIIQYGVPIVGEGGQPIGIVAINFSPVELKKIVSTSLSEGAEGFGFILSRQGTYLYHPITRNTIDQVNIYDTLRESRVKVEEISDSISRGDPSWVSMKDADGHDSRIFLHPLPTSGWTAGLAYLSEQDAGEYEAESRRLYWFMNGLFSLSILLMILYVRRFSPRERSYWIVLVVTSLLFLSGIGFVWNRALESPHTREEFGSEELTITNQAVLAQFIEQQSEQAARSREEILYVPTGIYIQHMTYTNPFDVMLSGYIWQTYSKTQKSYRDGTPISQGIILAETEPNAEVLSIEEAYRQDRGDHEIVGWYFRVSVRQDFDYSHYPFDLQTVWLRMWHQDFNRQVVLVPDLDSYKILTPVALPGMERNFVLPNWSLRASYFNYKFNSYNSTFGVRSETSDEAQPELYFNVVV
ncbi:MAG: cache domain-containing protein, partial [Candidatus Latescibacteria bacterium]|nr:cache domain-containing protein [Candidatus Latescibacterota bacterium]